jgi:hypothetical protein
MTDDLLVVGWDGATNHHLRQFELPFFDTLPHGDILLPEPYWQNREVDSGTAWTTITTGLSMWEHQVAMLSGMIENKTLFKLFSKLDHLFPRNLRGHPFRIWLRNKLLGGQSNNNRVPYKRTWHYIPNSLAFRIPVTYPPKPTTGVTVSGFPSPEVEVEPSRLAESVRKLYSGEPKRFLNNNSERSYIKQLFNTHQKELETISWLSKNHDFQFHFVVFTLLDRLLHVVERGNESIERAYRTIDETTSTLVEQLNPDDILIISDHGMKYEPRGKWRHVHDESSGIWAGTQNFDLRTHLDFTPTVLDHYGIEMNNPEYLREEQIICDGEMSEQLRDLGYL